MKKYYFLFTALAVLALTTGCKKDQELVTLSAHIDQPSKTYINDNRYPCWHNGDQVHINNATYSISSASGPSAEIVDVVSADAYRAIFPARLVTSGSDISYSAGIPVTLPSTQVYTMEDGHQRVDAPMGAYITSGTSLQFYNLCSIVRVTVNNATGSNLSVDRIILKTDNARLSGTGVATIDGTAESIISMDGTASHSVSLKIPGNSPVTVAQTPVSFDIIVPGFPTDNVTITLYTTDGYFFELTKNNVALTHNTVTTVRLNVSRLNEIVAAELVDGPTFHAAIPDNATAVVFEYNNPAVFDTVLSTSNSPVPIYGHLDGTTWRVITAARMMNANQNCYRMFATTIGGGIWPPRLETIDFGEGFNTSNVTNMGEMFSYCDLLRNLDVSHFNTSNVTNMAGMFYACHNLTCLDVSNFNTSNVTNMGSVFLECRSLSSLDVSHFNTSNVIDMGWMFRECSGLTSLDLSNFNTSNVTDMSWMFYDCESLTGLDLSSFNTSNVTDMNGMFYYCSRLTSLDISHFNTSNVTNMAVMLAHCESLTSLDLSHFNTSNVTDMNSMFYFCNGLTSLDVSHFNTSNVTNMGGMFRECHGLTSLDVSHFNTSNVTNMNCMFYRCYDLTSLDVSHFNTSNVTAMGGMFAGCRSLTSLDVSNFNTSIVTDMWSMFEGCSGMTSLDLSNFNTASVTHMYNMFYHCSNLTSLDLSYFDISDTTNKSGMCNGLSTTSGHCTIICSADVEAAIKELNPNYDPSNEYGYPYYITALPTSGVTFTWVRPATSK